MEGIIFSYSKKGLSIKKTKKKKQEKFIFNVIWLNCVKKGTNS
jgi:hypothetical protein